MRLWYIKYIDNLVNTQLKCLHLKILSEGKKRVIYVSSFTRYFNFSEVSSVINVNSGTSPSLADFYCKKITVTRET